jgi:RNA polymerase sigma factor (sigma-70 family)
MACREEQAGTASIGAEYVELPIAEEMSLVAAAKAGNKRAQDKLWRHIYRYLVRMAHSLAAQSRNAKSPTVRGRVTPEDILGIFGVVYMETLQRFDTSRGLRFLTYASYWFRAGAQEFIGRPSRGERAVRQAMAQAHVEGRVLDANELAEQCGVRGSTVERTIASLVALDAPTGHDANGAHTIADELDMGLPTTEEQLIERQDQQRRVAALKRAMKSLSPRERKILENQMAEEPLSYRAMESIIGVTYERIRQLDHAARDLVRARVEQELGDGFGPGRTFPVDRDERHPATFVLPKKPPQSRVEAGQQALLFVDG